MSVNQEILSDNPPLLSGGHIRMFGVSAPWWMLVLGALLASTAAWLRYGPGWAAPAAAAFLFVLLIISFIDLKRHIIPNAISLPAALAALALVPLRSDASWQSLLVGGLFAAGLVLGISLIGGLLFRKSAMGWGDVKLALFIGLVVGWPSVIISIYVAFIAGGLAAAALILGRRTRVGGYLAYGPFLALGGVVGLWWGQAIWLWYTGGLI